MLIPGYSARMLSAIVTAGEGLNAALGTDFQRQMRGYVIATAMAAACTGFRVWASVRAEVLTVARLRRLLFSSLLEKDIAMYDREVRPPPSRRLSPRRLPGQFFWPRLTGGVVLCRARGS